MTEIVLTEPDPVPHNLPRQLTSFVGRDAELLEVQKLLAEQRLVTLAGPGGCGKTRLAIAVAESLDRWPDGVWWVDLDAINDPALLARAVASSARALVDPIGDPKLALAAQLRGRRVLMCLDTCEHLLEPCAELVDTLLRACPDMSVLTTSREPLGVPGEAVWRVPPLAIDQAVRLFADRAALVRSDYTGGGDAEHAICERLDGIPLAVELAAAWMHTLSDDEIAARLDGRLRLLTGGPRLVADRHRTLAASLTWSHDLLDEPERVLFRRLAVFSGGFGLDAAAAVCAGGADVLEAVSRLVDKSLVVAGHTDGAVRYRMLDTIREYAAERLDEAGETAAVRDRHLDHFLAFAEDAESGLERDQDRWRTVLETEHDNLRSALHWGLAATDPERGRRLAAALARFWYVRGHIDEGLGLMHRAIERAPEERTTLQASLLFGAAMVGTGSGRHVLVADLARRGLEIAVEVGDDRLRGRCLALAGYGGFFVDFQGLRELTVEGERWGAIAGDPVAVEYARILHARSFSNRDQHAEAVREIGDVRAMAEARGERSGAAFAIGVEVWSALFTGDLPRAVTLGREALTVAEPLRDYFTVGSMACNLAWAIGLTGDLDGAHAVIDPVIRGLTDAGLELFRWFALVPGRLHLWGGDIDEAIRWLRIAVSFTEETSENWQVAQVLPALADALRRDARPDEAKAHADRALALGRKLDIPHVRAAALDQQGFLAAVDDRARAADLHHEALAVRLAAGLRTFWVDSLDALARVSEDPVTAARLLAASDAARAALGYPRPPVDRADHDATVAAVQDALGADAFTEAWTQGAALTLDEAVAYATRFRGSRSRPATGWASLTPTERRVVDLIVAGLSNPEIGARLFMSRSTVKTHLAHIYAKLDVANRAELAALAGRRLATDR